MQLQLMQGARDAQKRPHASVLSSSVTSPVVSRDPTDRAVGLVLGRVGSGPTTHSHLPAVQSR